jgi:hypothetical protein
MTVVQSIMGRTRSFMRKAAILLAGTQLILGTAPLLETGSRSASAHVESKGVQLHHAHDEANCIACTAHRLLGGAEPVQAPLADTPDRIVARSPELAGRPAAGNALLQRSRAPPSPVLS